jgi:hypothetical protein
MRRTVIRSICLTLVGTFVCTAPSACNSRGTSETGHVELAYLNSSATTIVFALRNGTQHTISFKGRRAAGSEGRFLAYDWSISCYLKGSPESKSLLPSLKDRHKAEHIEVAPLSMLELSIEAPEVHELAEGSCHIELALEGGARVKSTDFEM